MVSLSKWFVGSSNISNSHGVISADAKETLFLWPPDNSFTFWLKLVIPSLVKTVLASLSKSQRLRASIFSCNDISLVFLGIQVEVSFH